MCVCTLAPSLVLIKTAMLLLLQATCVATHVCRITLVSLNPPVGLSSLCHCQSVSRRKVALLRPDPAPVSELPRLKPVHVCERGITRARCFSRFLPAGEVAVHARGEALSPFAAEKGDDLRPTGGPGLCSHRSVLRPSERPLPKVRPVPRHGAPPRHPAAVAARRPVRPPPKPRPPVPAAVRQLARVQPDH